MNTLATINPVHPSIFLPLWRREPQIIYPQNPKINRDISSDYSNENPIPASYNIGMEWETWLNNLLESDTAEKQLSIIDGVLPECNSEQRHQTEVVKNALSQQLNEKSILPLLEGNPIDAYKADDDVILIEWSFKNLGLGFCLAPDRSESGWYVTSNDKAGNLFRSGLLSSDQEIISVTTSMVSMLQDHIGELNI